MTTQDLYSENILKIIDLAKGTQNPQHLKNSLQLRGCGFMSDTGSLTVASMPIVIEFNYTGGAIIEGENKYPFRWPFELIEEN